MPLYKQKKMLLKLIIIIGLIIITTLFDSLSAQIILDPVIVTSKKVDIRQLKIKEQRDEALKDISLGKIYIYRYGYQIREIGSEKLEQQIDSLAKVYGFEYKLGGCSRPEGSEAYYEEVMKYLEKRNGIGWKNNFDEEVRFLENTFYNEQIE